MNSATLVETRPGALLTALEDAQRAHEYKYLSEETMRSIAETTGEPLSRVYSVATFYSFFNLKPQGKHTIVVCRGTAAGTSPYAFVEIMSCPGGCIGGGGQPVAPTWLKREKRKAAIYTEDRLLPLRKSHDNPEVKTLYAEFLGAPLEHASHQLLHTDYAHKKV